MTITDVNKIQRYYDNQRAEYLALQKSLLGVEDRVERLDIYVAYLFDKAVTLRNQSYNCKDMVRGEGFERVVEALDAVKACLDNDEHRLFGAVPYGAIID